MILEAGIEYCGPYVLTSFGERLYEHVKNQSGLFGNFGCENKVEKDDPYCDLCVPINENERVN